MKLKKLPTPPSSSDESSADESGSSSESESEGMVENEVAAAVPVAKTQAPKKLALDNTLITRILDESSASDMKLSFKKGLQQLDLSSFSNDSFSEADLKRELIKLHRRICQRMNVGETLQLALKGNFLKRKATRKINGYGLFLKDFHNSHGELTILERFKAAPQAYKSLSESERKRYGEQAATANLEMNGITANGQSTKSPKTPKKAKEVVPNLKTFFKVVESPQVVKESPSKKAVKEISTKKAEKDSPSKKAVKEVSSKKAAVVPDSEVDSPAPSKPIKPTSAKVAKTKPSKKKDSDDEESATVAVNVFDYFAEERKIKVGKESADETKKAYAKLSGEEKVKYIYRIMQLVEKKFNKPIKLCKADQDLLNKHEKRPQHPGTAYTLFLLEKSTEPHMAQLPFVERSSELGKIWKQLDPREKAKYEEKFLKKKAAYDSSYQEFLSKLPEFRREQERKPKKRAPRRRASVGEAPPTLDDEEDVFITLGDPQTKESEAAAAKRRKRAKTIDCSQIDLNNFLVTQLDVAATPVKAKKRKAEPVEVAIPAPEVPPVISSPKKAKKQKKAATASLPIREVTPPPSPPSPPPSPVKSPKKTEPKEKAKEKKARKSKAKLTEPIKPPDSAKAYFKSVYQGDAAKAGKVFKKLSIEEKQKYHEQLKTISEKYLHDLTNYMQSLTKAELTEYMKRNQH